MINNRQNGRRRGRGGQRVGGGNPGRPESGNRIDNRARGNASQLYEKYKTLAADAQRQGDRVNTEYYLQFADHYFRVLAESRPRADEQQAQRRGRDDYDDEYDGDGGEEYGQEGEAGQPDQYQPRADDRPRQDGRGQEYRSQDGRPVQDRQPQERQGQDGRQQQPRRDERPRQDARPDERPRQDERSRQEYRQDDQPRRMDRPRRDGVSDGRPRADRPREDGARDDRYARPDRAPAAPVVDDLNQAAVTGDDRLTGPEPATQEASTPRAVDMDAPAPRRRGRPPKVRVDEAAGSADSAPEPLSFDADRLPPSLSVSASAEPDTGEPVEKPRRRRRVAAEPVEAGPAS